MRLARISPLIVFATAILFLAPFAHASSTLWNTTIQGAVAVCFSGSACPGTPSYGTADYPYATTMGINNPNTTIQYRAFIKNADTGQVVLTNASVPVGTNLELAFDEHVTEDIYWFGTGGYLDSPYGDWGDPDDAPPIQCLDKDYVGGNPDPVLSYASYRNYISFVVRPPSKSIDGMSTEQLSCTSFDGSKQPCTAVKAGTLPLVFNFASTDGKMYGRSYGVHSNVCFGINTPMTVKLGAYWKASTRAWETFFAPGGGATTQTIAVSQESIPYPITVVDAVGQPPTPSRWPPPIPMVTTSATASTGTQTAPSTSSSHRQAMSRQAPRRAPRERTPSQEARPSKSSPRTKAASPQPGPRSRSIAVTRQPPASTRTTTRTPMRITTTPTTFLSEPSSTCVLSPHSSNPATPPRSTGLPPASRPAPSQLPTATRGAHCNPRSVVRLPSPSWAKPPTRSRV